jgi:5-methylcytosine-specific restriction endonuclease McrA
MRPLHIGQGGKAVWQFLCDCGKEAETTADRVIQKITKSCGCLEIENRIKHGKSKTLEYHREAHRKWTKANPHLAILNANRRREDFRRRIPKWLTKEHWDQIRAFYIEAAKLTAETGIPHVVDHIHPLRGKTVSGLHVPWNLQVITRDENLRKSARF